MFGGILISKSIEITDACHPSFRGLSGTILDETKQTFLLDIGISRIIVPKSIISFRLLENAANAQDFVGRELLAAPHERLNKI